MAKHTNELQRYTVAERSNHWMVALLFFLAAFSGLALFHPSLFWLSNFFGGGTWTRILHPFMGVLMFVFFAILAIRFWHHNTLTKNDRAWLAHWKDVIADNERNIPPAGRYNGGQKVLFWIMVVCLITLAITGFLFWRPWFAPNFPIGLVRFAALLHAFAAWVLIAGVMIHIYAAFWVKGTMQGMLSGWVTRAWAKVNHPLWYREVTRNEKQS